VPLLKEMTAELRFPHPRIARDPPPELVPPQSPMLADLLHRDVSYGHIECGNRGRFSFHKRSAISRVHRIPIQNRAGSHPAI